MQLPITSPYLVCAIGSVYVEAKIEAAASQIRKALRNAPGPSWLRRMWPPRGKSLAGIVDVADGAGGMRESLCSIDARNRTVAFPQDVSRAMIPSMRLFIKRTEWADHGFLRVPWARQCDEARQGGSCCIGGDDHGDDQCHDQSPHIDEIHKSYGWGPSD